MNRLISSAAYIYVFARGEYEGMQIQEHFQIIFRAVLGQRLARLCGAFTKGITSFISYFIDKLVFF